MKKFLFCLLLLSACTTRKPHPAPTHSARLFPMGIYKHWVSLKIHRQMKDEDHNFLGVVELKAHEIKVVGLSPFGSTLFRIVDSDPQSNDPARLNIEIYIEAMRPFEPRLKEMYALLKRVLELPRSSQLDWGKGLKIISLNPSGLPEQIEAKNADDRIKIKLGPYTADSIPKFFSIEHSSFDVSVKVSDYTP